MTVCLRREIVIGAQPTCVEWWLHATVAFVALDTNKFNRNLDFITFVFNRRSLKYLVYI